MPSNDRAVDRLDQKLVDAGAADFDQQIPVEGVRVENNRNAGRRRDVRVPQPAQKGQAVDRRHPQLGDQEIGSPDCEQLDGVRRVVAVPDIRSRNSETDHEVADDISQLAVTVGDKWVNL